MILLTIRTDKPEAELGLYDSTKQIDYLVWEAHRQLAETIHAKIDGLLREHSYTLESIQGIVCYQGPGSFTGLRIGLTVANTLAHSLAVPIAATQNPRWIETGVDMALRGENHTQALPFYGAEVHITEQKK